MDLRIFIQAALLGRAARTLGSSPRCEIKIYDINAARAHVPVSF